MRQILRSQEGVALMVVVGAISVAMLVGVLALSKRLQSAQATRTGTAHVESAAYLNSLQQMLSNQKFCTDNMVANMGQESINYDPLGAGLGKTPTQLTFNTLTSTSDGSNTVMAGQTSSSKLAMSNLVTSQKPYIDLTKNFQYYGNQSTGAPGVLNNQCFGATLHADVNLESQQTGPRRSIGSQTVGADYPIVVMTDSSNKLAGCFLGVASSFCKPPAPPVITNWTPDNGCHDGWQTSAFTIGFAVQNSVKSVMTCTGSTTPPVITDVTGLTSYSGKTPLNFIGCTLEAFDQIGDSVSQSTTLNFNPKECDIAKIKLPSVPACVNAGQSFSVGWQDSANDPNDLITLTFGATPTQTQMATLASNSGTVSFTAPADPATSILISANDNDVQGDGGGATASVQVKATPTVSAFSVDQPSYDADHIPANITLSWTTPGADSVDIDTGVGAGLPANSARSVGAPSSTTTYTLTAHGGCPGTPDATKSVTVNVTGCTCDSTVAAATPLGQAFNDSCGMPKCTGTQAPACTTVPQQFSATIGYHQCPPVGDHALGPDPSMWEDQSGQYRLRGGSSDHPAGTVMPPLECTGMNFNVPSNATVTGLTVHYGLVDDNGRSVLTDLKLLEGGAVIADKNVNQVCTHKNAVGIYDTGGSTDMWGAALTPAIVNDPSFAIDFQFTDNNSRMYFEGTATSATVYANIPVATSGACGSATTSNTLPTSNLCADNSMPHVTDTSGVGTGPWTWTCGGSCGGTNTPCSTTPAETPCGGQGQVLATGTACIYSGEIGVDAYPGYVGSTSCGLCCGNSSSTGTTVPQSCHDCTSYSTICENYDYSSDPENPTCTDYENVCNGYGPYNSCNPAVDPNCSCDASYGTCGGYTPGGTGQINMFGNAGDNFNVFGGYGCLTNEGYEGTCFMRGAGPAQETNATCGAWNSFEHANGNTADYSACTPIVNTNPTDGIAVNQPLVHCVNSGAECTEAVGCCSGLVCVGNLPSGPGTCQVPANNCLAQGSSCERGVGSLNCCSPYSCQGGYNSTCN